MKNVLTYLYFSAVAFILGVLAILAVREIDYDYKWFVVIAVGFIIMMNGLVKLWFIWKYRGKKNE